MTSVQQSNSRRPSADKIVSLPSFSSGLSSLPQAKSMANVSLHPNMYAQRAAESEAKLKTVLSKTAASHPQNPPPIPSYMNPPPHNPNSSTSSPPLMMRKSKPKSTA